MPVRPTDTPLPQRYRTIRRLGRGGMATVFLAEDPPRMTGDPEAAIPALERRLEFSSDRTDVVRRELELARQAAGE